MSMGPRRHSIISIEAEKVGCKIVLNDQKNVYNPGDEIIGEVHVNYLEEFGFYGLKLVLEGLVNIKYTENDCFYEKRESILTESKYLLGDCAGLHKIRANPMTNSTYTFAIQIPPMDVPGSFHGQFGQINYHLNLLVDYGENKLVKKAGNSIIINAHRDLDPDDMANLNPIILEKFCQTAVKQIAYNKSVAEPGLKFTCRLEKGGFICGEEIEFEVDLDIPKEEYKVKGITVGLVERITYHGGSALKTTNRILTSAAIPEHGTDPAEFVPPDSSEHPWRGTILIPQGLMPSQNGDIEFEYFIKVTVALARSKDVLTGECLIAIGTTREGQSVDGQEHETSRDYYYTSALELPSHTETVENGNCETKRQRAPAIQTRRMSMPHLH